MANPKDQDIDKKSQEELDAAAKAEAEAKAKADEEAGKGTGKGNSADDKDKSASWEEEIKRRDGTISALQKQVNEYQSFQKKLAGVFTPEGEGNGEPTLQDALKQIEDLKKENQTSKSEKARDAYIESLEVSEARKKELKRRVSPNSEDVAKAVDEENDALNILLQNESGSSKENNNSNRFISNKRPVADKFSKSIPNSDNAAEILAAAEGK